MCYAFYIIFYGGGFNVPCWVTNVGRQEYVVLRAYTLLYAVVFIFLFWD